MAITQYMATIGVWKVEYAQINQSTQFGVDAEAIALPVAVKNHREYIIGVRDQVSGLTAIGNLTVLQAVGGSSPVITFVDSGNILLTSNGMHASGAAYLAAGRDCTGTVPCGTSKAVATGGSEILFDPSVGANGSFYKKYSGDGDAYFVILSR